LQTPGDASCHDTRAEMDEFAFDDGHTDLIGAEESRPCRQNSSLFAAPVASPFNRSTNALHLFEFVRHSLRIRQ
ncbi:MAG TPA: hypothetical protein PLV87_17365, partial [Opitutaceae bacterium]|nr:hypothetical protein [Opitutaceae bacterium]